MRIYICDDNDLDALRLRRMLAKYAQRFGCDPTVKVFPSAERLLSALERGESAPDLLFLDVYMGELNGVEALERLRSGGEKPVPVIFSTSSQSHAIDAFRLRAVGYLHKPYTQEDFDHALTRVEGLFAAAGRALQVWVREQESGQSILLDDIVYMETDGRGTLLHVGGESSRKGVCARLRQANGQTDGLCAVSSRTSMREYRAELAGQEDFCECGRSYLVNLSHAVEMTERGLRMDCGEIVPTPERLRSEVGRRLEHWRQHDGSLPL